MRGRVGAAGGILGVLALAVAATSCGSPGPQPTPSTSTPVPRPSATPSASVQPSPAPTATATPAPAPAATPVPVRTPAPQAVAILGPPDLKTGTQVLSLVGVDGRVLGSATLAWPTSPALGAAPDGIDFISGGRLREITLSGRTVDLGAAPAPAPEPFGELAVSPDGRQIAYSVITGDRNFGPWHNQLWVMRIGGSSRLLADRVVTGTSHFTDAPIVWQYRLLGWTSAGIVIDRAPIGVGGGDFPFVDEGYQWYTALVDPSTGMATPLTSGQLCALSGVAVDGSSVCFRRVAGSIGSVSIELRSPGGAVTVWSLSGQNVAGSAQIDSVAHRLAYATVPIEYSSPESLWRTHAVLRVLDMSSGQAHVVGPSGLVPLGWMADGRILAERWPAGMTAPPDGTPSLVTVDPATGALRSITTIHGEVAGVVSAR